MKIKYLERSFFEQDTLTAAKALLGKNLVLKMDNGCLLKGRIVETEAYCGTKDKAAHAYKGIPTKRTEILYQEGGHAYIYMIYGIYHCLNIVTGQENRPECVLIRALQPVLGISEMEANRHTTRKENLCSGPGKLCQAMGINRQLNGADLCRGNFFIEDGEKQTETITAAKRIGIDYAEEAKDFLWRFYLKDNRYVSKR